MFASVDLTGSTAFKQRESASTERPWQFHFEDFFKNFPGAVHEAYTESAAFQCKEKLRVWKVQGDEILFECPLTRFEEVVPHIRALKSAASEYNTLNQRKGVRSLCKVTAWTAGFPVTNTEVRIPSPGGEVNDYLGPSIDIGFRLTRHATPRKFVISLELALLLLDAWQKLPDLDPPSYYFEEPRRLEGVLRCDAYPLIWIDLDDGKPSLEEQLQGLRRKPCDSDRLRQYCHRFLRENGWHPPFIDGDPHERYGLIPPELEERRAALKKQARLREKNEATGRPVDQTKGDSTLIDQVGELPPDLGEVDRNED